MSNTAKLDQQLDKLQVELTATKAARTQVGEKLALDPTDAKLIAAAREATAKVQGLTADIEILKGAREAANAADSRAAAEAIRANALNNLKAIENLLAQRVKAAKQIDEALARLCQVNQNWLAVNDECATTIEAFRRAMYGSGERAAEGVRGMKNTVINAIVDNVSEALKGFDSYGLVSFNHLRHNAHETESAARDTGICSERMWQRCRDVAMDKGLL